MDNLDNVDVNANMEQGKLHRDTERISSKLFANLSSFIHYSYNGQAARHMSMVDSDTLLVSNAENKVDVYNIGD